jgi:5'-deoxy-5'-methylthioadenosine phosphorylase
MTVELAIIGGSGLTSMEGLEIIRKEVMHTPFGEPSAPVTFGRLNGIEIAFLPRHGAGHTIPPHQINYRANIWALKHMGIQQVIAMAAVGGITDQMAPGRIAIPDQIIDYTSGRGHTFFENNLSHVTHVDFTEPYCEELRGKLQAAAKACCDTGVIPNGTYGATQGPRLESKAEITRLERDGCDLVGMTGMPEAALARELELCYACCAVVANWAAGKGDGGIITIKDINETLKGGMEQAQRLLLTLAKML